MTKRKSNFELLRIVAMLLIIAYHFSAHMNYHPFYSNEIESKVIGFTAILLGSWGILGVDLFVLISANFLIDKKFSCKKIIYLVFQTFTYMFFFTLIDCIYQGSNVGFLGGMKYALILLIDGILQPFWSKDYWYISAYFFLYLLVPWLNKIIAEMEFNKYRKTLIILSFIPFYSNFVQGSTVVVNVINFAYIYLVVGYLKRKEDTEKNTKNSLWCCALITGIIIFSLWLDWVLPNGGVLGLLHSFIHYTTGNINRHSVIILLNAFFVFDVFKGLKINSYAIINLLASCTFGIYLFHENPVFFNVTELIGKIFVENGYLSTGKMFPFKFICVTIFIFCCGAMIECIRKQLLDKTIFKYLCYKMELILKKIDSWFII